MAIKRLKVRAPSAVFTCVAMLMNYQLNFHKPSKDGSGKCNVVCTENAQDKVLGAIYSIHAHDLVDLDKYEIGYLRKTVVVLTNKNDMFEAQTYISVNNNSQLCPYDWYREHVLRGAKEVKLPDSYIAMIGNVNAVIDENQERRNKELAIYR